MRVTTNTEISSFQDYSFDNTLHKAAQDLASQNMSLRGIFSSKKSTPSAAPVSPQNIAESAARASSAKSHYNEIYPTAERNAVMSFGQKRKQGKTTIAFTKADQTVKVDLSKGMKGNDATQEYSIKPNAASKAYDELVNAHNTLVRYERGDGISERKVNKAIQTIRQQAPLLNSLKLA